MASRQAESTSGELAGIKKTLEGVAASSEKVIKTKKNLNSAMVKMGVTLKAQNKSWKDLGLSTKLVTKAFKGHVASIEKTRIAYKKFQNDQKKAGNGMLDIKNKGRLLQHSFATNRSRLLLLSFAYSLYARTLLAAFKAASEQQQAEIKLSSALGRTSKNLLEHASAMQQSTRFGDEAVIGAQASIAAFIKDEDTIKSLTEATLDLAAAKGMDLTAAADLVAKSVGSSTNALARYGIAANGAAKSTERAESVVKNISVLYGGQARDQAKSYAGTLDGMKNAVGDAAEAIGELLAPIIIVLSEGLMRTALMVESFVDWLTTAAVSVDNFFFGLTNLKEASIDFTKSLSDFQKDLGKMSFDEINAGIELNTELFGTSTEVLDTNKESYNRATKGLDVFDAANGKINKSIKESIDNSIALGNSQNGLAVSTNNMNDSLEDSAKTNENVANAVNFRINVENELELLEQERTRRQGFAQEIFAKTATAQKANIQRTIDWVKENKNAFDTTEDYTASLKMLKAQLESTTTKEDELLKKRIGSLSMATGMASKAFSAEKTLIESRMNLELKALRETSRFKRMDSRRQANAEKGITDKYAEARRKNWENEKNAKIGQATLNAYSAITKAWSQGGFFGGAMAAFVGVMAFKQISAMMAMKAPKFALGGDFITQGPQNIIVGDNPGGRERVQVTPLSSPNIEGPQGGASVVVNVSGNVMTQDFVEDELAEAIKEAARRGTDFGIT